MSYHIRSICLVAFIVGVASCVAEPDSDNCVGEAMCSKNDVVPLKDWQYCKWYCTCENGKFVPKECYLGRTYNRIMKKCVIGPPNCPQPTTTANPTEPTDTPNTKPTHAPTEEPTKAPTEKPTKAPTTAPTTKPTTAPTTSKPKVPCTSPEGTKKGIKDDCKLYQVCTKGFWTDPVSCSLGYYFNSASLNCEFNLACEYCSCL